MAERFLTFLRSNSGGDLPAEMWDMGQPETPDHEARLQVARTLLEAAGFDSGARDIMAAIANIRPAALSAGALAILSESERVEYEFEQEALRRSGFGAWNET